MRGNVSKELSSEDKAESTDRMMEISLVVDLIGRSSDESVPCLLFLTVPPRTFYIIRHCAKYATGP